jgi:hypothetical protein
MHFLHSWVWIRAILPDVIATAAAITHETPGTQCVAAPFQDRDLSVSNHR